jgi:hypothetical protein
MSLIGIRRERRGLHGGPVKPPSLWKLVLMLALVMFAIWWLGRLS